MADGYRCDACRHRADRCDDCRARRAAVKRARRARYRRTGLCVDCGRPALADMARCAECRDANNERSGAAHAARRAEEG